jgi:hypothetical protein
MKLNKNVKEGISAVLKITIGLPLMAAGFIAIVLGCLALLFGIPFALMSSSNHVLSTIGLVWGSLSMFGFFGYILFTMDA